MGIDEIRKSVSRTLEYCRGTCVVYERVLLDTQAIKKVVEARTNICKSLITEQENQVKGLEAAIANMDEHYNQISGAYTGFKSYYIQLFEKHKNLLQYFESDMQKVKVMIQTTDQQLQLRETTIHPALATSGVKTLMDFVPEARLRKWAEECASEHGINFTYCTSSLLQCRAIGYQSC